LKIELRWEDNIKIDVKERYIKESMYKYVAKNRIQRKDSILAVSNHRDMLPVCWFHSYMSFNIKNLQSSYL